MRLRIASVIATLLLWAVPAQAQSQAQINALVEAFRKAAPQTGTANDG